MTEGRVAGRYLHMHRVVGLFIQSQHMKAAQVSISDEWMKKMWQTHVMKYKAFQKMEILSHTPTRMNLENMMLSQVGSS